MVRRSLITKMNTITVKDKVFKPFLPYEKIMEAIDGVAVRLNEDFKDADEVPVMICTLNGAMMFTAELFKRINFDCELMSVKMTSYSGTQSTGKVLNTLGLTGDVTGRTVIVCEDIVDTGNTIVALKQMLLSKGVKDVKVCTMLLKPEVYTKDEKLDYVGMEIPNKFIVGFGLDYDELGRNLKDIYVINE